MLTGKNTNPTNWDISAPRAGNDEPLIIQFHEPLDYALAKECLRVMGNREISGQILLKNNERIWCFIPDNHWAPG